jgi:hypothetical protein
VKKGDDSENSDLFDLLSGEPTVTQATILDYNERKRVLNGPAKGWKAHAP